MLALLALVVATAQTPILPPDYHQRVAELELARQARPTEPDVLAALAGSYAMGGQYKKAIAVLRDMLALDVPPGKRAQWQLNLARNQAWDGQTGRAIRTYESYLKARPQDRQAAVELIRLYRYRGQYGQAEELCNRLLREHPDDAEVLALKAEVLHWAGNRRFLARRTAGRALALAPADPAVQVAHIYALRDVGNNREALRRLADLERQLDSEGASYSDAVRLLKEQLPARAVTAPAYAVYNDSDGIRNVSAGLRTEIPLFDDHRLRFDVQHHRTSAPAGSIFTTDRSNSAAGEFSAGGTACLGPAVYVTMSGGGWRRSGSTALRPIFNLQLSTAPFDRLTADFSAGREFLGITPRAVDLDIGSYRIAGATHYAFDARTSLALHGERRYWSDDNRSHAAEATLRRILHYYRPFMIDAGALSRWESFERDTRFSAGFFTPDQYWRHDGFLGLHGELARRLSYELRGAAGAQKVARGADYRLGWEAAASLWVRLAGSLDLSAGYQRRNYSLLARQGSYQGFYVSLGIRP